MVSLRLLVRPVMSACRPAQSHTSPSSDLGKLKGLQWSARMSARRERREEGEKARAREREAADQHQPRLGCSPAAQRKGNRRTTGRFGGVQGLERLQMPTSDLTVLRLASSKVYCRGGYPYTIVCLYLGHSASTCEERIRRAQQGQREGVQLPSMIYTECAGGNCQQRPFWRDSEPPVHSESGVRRLLTLLTTLPFRKGSVILKPRSRERLNRSTACCTHFE
jgi:hypothetical protein